LFWTPAFAVVRIQENFYEIVKYYEALFRKKWKYASQKIIEDLKSDPFQAFFRGMNFAN